MSFNTSYNVGGVVDEVKKIPLVERIGEIGRIAAFPEFRQPYNEMIQEKIPSVKEKFTFRFNLPPEETEILAITVTCTGYGEGDYFNMFCNGRQWYKTWYLNEIKEGLFLGTSTFAYKAPANSEIELEFYNDSGTSKTLWVGFRMLVKGD